MEARAGGSSVVRLVRWCRGGSEVGSLQEGGGGCGSVEVAPASSGGSCNVGGVRAGVAMSRWLRRRWGQWAWSRLRAGVATSNGSGCGGCGLGELAAGWGRVWRCQGFVGID